MNARGTLVGCGSVLVILLCSGLAWSQTAPAGPAATGPATTWPIVSGEESPSINTPLGCLSAVLKDSDPQKVRIALVALRSTEDKELLPLFVALTRGSDDGRRFRATVAISELAGKAAVPYLLERLRNDAEMAVRASALVELLRLDAIDCKELAAQLKVPDKNVQGISARAIVSKALRKNAGADAPADAQPTTAAAPAAATTSADLPTPQQLTLAKETLLQLTKSDDLAVAGMARLSLLSLGDDSQLETLKATINDPQTPNEIQGLLMTEIANQKISAAIPLAQIVLDRTSEPSAGTAGMRQTAYRALLANDPQMGKLLVQEIKKSDQTVMRVALLRTLMLSRESSRLAAELTKGDDAPAALARFEVARMAITDSGFTAELGQNAATAAAEALATGHPIVIDYVLSRVKMDVARLKDNAGFYVPALTELTRSVPPNPDRLGAEHIRAAEACTDLADIGTPAAMDALKDLIAGKYSAIVRSGASGLLRSTNPKVCDLAKPLLDNPHPELSDVAMLVLGRFADPAAAKSLQKTLDDHSRHSPAMLALCSWYLAKIDKSSAQLARTLAEQIK